MTISKQHHANRMNISAPGTECPRAELCTSTRGAALIITLALLVLVTTLVVTLFLTVTNERTESAAAANQSDAQHLANSVVNLVKSTITQATSGYESNVDGSLITASPTAWVSQPGLIRTWKLNGTPDRSFRLYSSGTIAVTGTLDMAAELTALNNWKSGTPANSTNSYNALWCDLNAPALNQAGERIYPIITPPKDVNSGSTVTDTDYGVPTDNNPSTGTQLGVQGFSITAAPGYTSGSASSTNNPAPMPVKWLYILQDGSYITPMGSGTNATIPGASKTNPIVGRIAYWTDDETCKVNINTASEYYYWEAPSTCSVPDANRAMYQPGVNEYQRYPGHPSTTCLSTVFEKLGPTSATETNADRAARYQLAFNLTPRIAGTTDGKPFTGGGNAGGSQAGTAISWFSSSTGLSIDPDRLYATADDILYSPARAEQLVNKGILNNVSDLQKRLSFLTTRSTSPDLNWMNKPRVSLWPLNPNETAKWSASDKLLDYCGRINSAIYYFQRTNGFDPSSDFNISRNKSLYNYLKNMLDTSIPGAGGRAYSSKTSRDPQQLLTNIFDYIRCFINTRYSGGSTGSGNNAVDDPAKSYYFPPGQASGYFGCFAATPTVVTTNGITTRGPGGYPVVTDVLLHFWAVKPGETSPASQTTDYPASVPASGASVTRTIQMGLLLNLCNVQANDNCPSPQYQIRVSGPGWSITNGPNPTDATILGGGAAAMNFPTAGGSIMRVYAPHTTQWDINQTGGFISLAWLYRGAKAGTNGFAQNYGNDYQTRTFSRTAAANTYTFYSDPIHLNIPIGTAIPVVGGTISRANYSDEAKYDSAAPNTIQSSANPAMMNFNGGKIKIEIFPGIKNGGTSEATDSYDVTSPSTKPIQTMTVNIPNCTLPVPTLGSGTILLKDTLITGSSYKSYYELGSWANRGLYKRVGTYIQKNGGTYNGGILNPWLMDVVRGVTLDPSAAHKGDLRVLAHAQNIPESWYKAEYGTGTLDKEFFLSSFLTNASTGGSQIGKLDSTASYPNYVASSYKIAAPTLSGMSRNGVTNVGDFITGRGVFPLGGYYLQPDMGSASRAKNGVPYFSSQEFTDARSLYNNLTYSPARMVGSPVILGKLSTFVSENSPNAWETLLFCPNPHGGSDSHTGWSNPKDHYLLDLFNMPVVEPYAISQPLSTDGRVNLNHQFAPFTYIKRNTGLYAAIKGTRAYAIAPSIAVKTNSSAPLTDTNDYTVAIDIDKTIAKINERAPFITASEFTEVFLVPQGQSTTTNEALATFWQNQKGTGDDLREAPYNHIYPKLTTKSNTFTVHMRVQMLKQVTAGGRTTADWQKWNEAKDQVVSEYRGSATIERYIDPNDAAIPDFAKPEYYNKNLAPYYRWRVLQRQQFVP